ncbi:unnamed protein product [Thlaspi arvense]|uniref:RING-type domain-containing protein n=1 Tax=Thlaspi arvense TaxID=13288 RepID=A0AAU9S563_THLAR|nr:unnamed protein product [Thlaspi arvense]
MAGTEDDDRNHRRGSGRSVDSAADNGGCVPGKRGNEDSSSPVEVSCSICLELVVDDGTRSRAKLQCGHEFHLGISIKLSLLRFFWVCWNLWGFCISSVRIANLPSFDPVSGLGSNSKP